VAPINRYGAQRAHQLRPRCIRTVRNRSQSQINHSINPSVPDLHQVAHLTVEVRESWRLVEHKVENPFDGGPSEEVKSLAIKQEVGFSVVKHISGPGYLAVLKTLEKKTICFSHLNATVSYLRFSQQRG